MKKKSEKSAVHPCVHFKECSGCQIGLESVPLAWQLFRKNLSEKISPDLLTFHLSLPSKWRHRAKLAVSAKEGAIQIGLYQENSHDVAAIPFCLVHHPLINNAADLLKNSLERENLSIYSETTGLGDLRYLQLTVSRLTQKIELVFVLNLSSQNDFKLEKWTHFIKKMSQNSDCFQSIWINFNTEKTNVIMGKEWLQVVNLSTHSFLLQEQLCGKLVHYHPASFYQANIDQFEALILNLKTQMSKDLRVLELFSGVGAIGLALLDKCASMHCVEINPFASIAFAASYSSLDEEERQKIAFSSGDASGFSHLLADIDCVVVDPPRKGLDLKLIAALNDAATVKQIFYISCDYASFERDLDIFLKHNWKLKQCDGYQFFPGTDHIEILTHLYRN